MAQDRRRFLQGGLTSAALSLQAQTVRQPNVLFLMADQFRFDAIAALGNRFGYLAQTLARQPYVAGQTYTIADPYLFVVLNWTNYHKVDLKPWPALTEFQTRVAKRPAVQATLKIEGLVK